jgi:hypothetical protein
MSKINRKHFFCCCCCSEYFHRKVGVSKPNPFTIDEHGKNLEEALAWIDDHAI